MIYDLRFTIRALALLAILHLPSSIFGQDYTVTCNSNGVIYAGFYLPATNLSGIVPTNNLPTNTVYTAQFTGGTNLVATNAAFQLLSVSNSLAAQLTTGTNWVYTNLNTKLTATSNALYSAGSSPALAVSNYLATNFSTTIVTTSNSLWTSITNSTNSLSATWNYNLGITSNGLAAQITAATNFSITASNTLNTKINTASNALQQAINTVSNNVNSIIVQKALTATVPATYSSIGIGFSAPLMPDGNYSVSLVPQDDNTAGAPQAGLYWYVNSKNASGFTIYLNYATNAYNLNFDCIVHENTQ